jgi:hypothetical protein
MMTGKQPQAIRLSDKEVKSNKKNLLAASDDHAELKGFAPK